MNNKAPSLYRIYMPPLFYRLDELDALPQRSHMGVMGNPIAHSKSPAMQQAALDAAGLPHRYVRLECSVEQGAFAAFLKELKKRGFFALNVTVPFKREAFLQAIKTDALSALCEASNTLNLKEDGWHAYNTDGPGFDQAIAAKWGLCLQDLKVVILGSCGGAGSALAAQSALAHCKSLCLVNRPRPELGAQLTRLNQVAPDSKMCAYHFDSPELPQLIAEADLIVNATVLGLHEQDPMPLSLDYLQPHHYLYDIVPHETAFARAAAARGVSCSTGEEMLLWQGARSFEHWFGISPDIQAMREGLFG